MAITLYCPDQVPVLLRGARFPLLSSKGHASVTAEIAQILGCAENLVDVLLSEQDYIVYSIFDNQGAINYNAMTLLNNLTGIEFSIEEDNVLRGNILIVSKY